MRKMVSKRGLEPNISKYEGKELEGLLISTYAEGSCL
jgi:hypothetical protein